MFVYTPFVYTQYCLYTHGKAYFDPNTSRKSLARERSVQIGRAGNLTSEIVPHDPFSRRASICNDGTGLVMVFGTVSGGVSGDVGL